VAYTVATPVRHLDFLHFSCNNFLIGEGTQHALKSWWPMDSTWNAHSSHAHWNEMSEAFFDKRLQELEGGEPEPLTANSWRNRMRARAHIRRVNTFMRSSSAAFLESVPVQPF
jgi:hypothetical protein